MQPELGPVEPAPARQEASVHPAPAPSSPAAADSVVCAAADAMNLPPRALRPALLAAFKRAHTLGLSVEAVKAWLESSEQLSVGGVASVGTSADQP